MENTPRKTAALSAALRWIELGFSPVPVPAGKKAPTIRGWQHLRIDAKSAAKYFNGAQQNIGILLGDERNTTDVDCDCEQAISAARTLLPTTKFVFGRNSKPSSHYFFLCDSPVTAKRYKDPVSKSTIVELRGQKTDRTIGLQTIVPPSVHVSGEKIRFEVGCGPDAANVQGSSLGRAVEKVAAAALLAIHWPAQGRHDCESALAGVLARNHWNEQEAVDFVLAAYTLVPDHDKSKLARVEDSVHDTFASIRSNSPATGLPSLAEHLSVPVSNAFCDWLHLDRGARQAGSGEEQACRFFCDERGVWAEEKERKPQFICPPLWIDARTSDFNDEGWGKLVRFQDPRSNEKTCIIPMAQLLGDNQEAIQRLVSSGFQPRSDPKSLRQLKQYISQAQPENFVTCIQRVGWHGEAFVFPEKIIGDTQKRFLFQGESGAHKYRKAGTLDQWKTEIARYCSGNSRLLFVTSCAFAAPIIDLVKTDNAGVHLRGITSTGKTTATRVGGSVVGGDGSARGFMESWRSTANGLEMQALLHNDMLLPLDEIAEIDERMVGEVVYMLGNGSTKGRATRTLSSRPSVQFRTLFTSTGERSLTEMMTAAGKVVKGGQEVRLIDIEADAGRKLGVFEKLHGFDSGQHLADYLTLATTKYYGTAITAFLEHVVAQRPSVIDRIQRGRENFVQACVQKGSASEVSRAASFFGLVALAGEEATACGITGWQRWEAHDSAMRLFREWVQNRGGIGSHDVDAGIRAVVAFLQSNLSRFQNLDRQESFLPKDRAGFSETDEEDGSIVHYIFPHVFEKVICGAYDHRAIARAMVERGYLKRQKASNFAIQKRLEGKPQRVYAVLPDIFDYDREAEQNSPPSLFQPEKVVTVGTGGLN
jgi:uncharacterized protein (DUF927 family)